MERDAGASLVIHENLRRTGLAAAATVVGTASVVDRLDPSAPIAATYLVFAVMGSVLLVGALTRAERPVPVVIARSFFSDSAATRIYPR